MASKYNIVSGPGPLHFLHAQNYLPGGRKPALRFKLDPDQKRDYGHDINVLAESLSRQDDGTTTYWMFEGTLSTKNRLWVEGCISMEDRHGWIIIYERGEVLKIEANTSGGELHTKVKDAVMLPSLGFVTSPGLHMLQNGDLAVTCDSGSRHYSIGFYTDGRRPSSFEDTRTTLDDIPAVYNATSREVQIASEVLKSFKDGLEKNIFIFPSNPYLSGREMQNTTIQLVGMLTPLVSAALPIIVR